ncbi:hypothetical protein ACEWY4_001832 [Coilia grayii]|uniref:TIR domain-containing protein n=1 Tax=Coilia grayii TaxID=363190 RepID=A0ABD1KU18_9TELE
MQLLNLTLIFGGFPHQLPHLTLTSPVRPMTLVIADDSTPDVSLSLFLSGQKTLIFELFLSTASFLLFLILPVHPHVPAAHQHQRALHDDDVYVSHSGKNESWVMNSFLPVMKRRGPPFFATLPAQEGRPAGKGHRGEHHGRSVQKLPHPLPGLPSLPAQQLVLPGDAARHLLYRLQAEHRDVLILVFLKEIHSNLLSAHHRLTRLVKTRTYIEWPQDPAQQEAFWDRLRDNLVPGIRH